MGGREREIKIDVKVPVVSIFAKPPLVLKSCATRGKFSRESINARSQCHGHNNRKK